MGYFCFTSTDLTCNLIFNCYVRGGILWTKRNEVSESNITILFTVTLCSKLISHHQWMDFSDFTILRQEYYAKARFYNVISYGSSSNISDLFFQRETWKFENRANFGIFGNIFSNLSLISLQQCLQFTRILYRNYMQAPICQLLRFGRISQFLHWLSGETSWKSKYFRLWDFSALWCKIVILDTKFSTLWDKF